MPERKINYAAINKGAQNNLRYIDEQLMKAGYGYIQRLAILGNVQRESSGNPLAVSSNGLWHGIIQGDKNRYRIQSNNAQAELQRQTALLLKELEKKGGSGQTWKDQLAYAQSFKDSADLKQAVDIFTRRFVRPGDINGEINKRFNFAQLGGQDEDDSEYDLETAKKVLPDSLIQAHRKNPEKSHLPSGYTNKDGEGHALKSVYHPSGKEEVDGQADPKNLEDMLHYSYNEDYVSKFPVYKPFYQKGGSLIYHTFDADTAPSTRLPEQKETLLVFNDSVDKFPVQSVSSGNIDYFSRPGHYTVPEEKPRGITEYKYKDMNLGNMRDLVDKAEELGVSLRITSGVRPGARTKSGKVSHHDIGNAIDVTPPTGQSGDEFEREVEEKGLLAGMGENGYRILDERSEAVRKKTGGTGPHGHISKHS